MNTPSHLLMTLAGRKAFKSKGIPLSAAIWGALAPDIALYVLSGAAWVYFEAFLGWPRQEVFEHLWGTLYFENPIWIFSHNLLQAPILLVVGLLLSLRMRACKPRLALWLQWFFIACLLHSFVDIVTHHDDGPLLLFPFQWSLRFHSPISYWDVQHHGGYFMFFEAIFDILCLGYLIREKLFGLLQRFKS